MRLQVSHTPKKGEEAAKDLSLSFSKGPNRICLVRPGKYTLSPARCFRFKKEQYAYSTASPAPITVEIPHYRLTGSIMTGEGLQLDATEVEVEIHSDSAKGDNGDGLTVVKAGRSDSGQRSSFHWHYWATYREQLRIVPRELTQVCSESTAGARARVQYE